MALSNPHLAELAAEFGIATEFWDWKGRLTEISDETVIAVLAGGAALYGRLGAPGYPDMPLAERIAMAETLRSTRPDQAKAEVGLPAAVPPEGVDAGADDIDVLAHAALLSIAATGRKAKVSCVMLNGTMQNSSSMPRCRSSSLASTMRLSTITSPRSST